MSFSSDVKKEIASDIPAAKHCRTASLAVLLREGTDIQDLQNRQ